MVQHEDNEWVEKFNKVFSQINERHETMSHIIMENIPMKFNSVEEARNYFKSIPFEEWLNNTKKKFDI